MLKSIYDTYKTYFKVKYTEFGSFNIFVCLMACQPAVRSGSTMARVPVFHTIKVIASDLRNCCSEKVYPLHHGASFILLLVSFHHQITYRKVRNLQIGVNKLVGKVSINLLHHAQSATCVISIFIDALYN